MRLLAGRFPQPMPRGSTPEALITQEMVQQQNAHLGDLLVAGLSASGDQVAVRVVGIWAPRQPDDPFWNGRSFSAAISTTQTVYPVLLDQNTSLATFAPALVPAVTQHWIAYTAPARITTDNAADVATNVARLRAHLNGDVQPLTRDQVDAQTALDQLIGEFQQQVVLLGLPLDVVAAQVIGLALLFVAAMAGLLTSGQASAVAMLKGRGASGVQLLGGFAVQGLALAAIAVAVSPWLASALTLVRWLVPAGTLSAAGVNVAQLRPLANGWQVAGLTVGGALLALGALLLGVQGAARRDMLALRREQGRATRPPLWRRYYLDVGLALLCALGYLELDQLGSLGIRER
jgi:putative ABC transport system permease protein